MDKYSLKPELLASWTRHQLSVPDYYTLADQDLARCCPLDNGRHVTKPQHSLGILSIFPLEILTEVLLCLDVPSLTTFRRVNNRGMRVVDSIPQYTTIYRHCPDILRGILSIEATYFDLQTLYNSLSDSRCTACGHFGGYLYLITCKRVCYACFTGNKLFHPKLWRRESIPRDLPQLEAHELRKLPHVKSIIGRYGHNRILHGQRLSLWDREAVLLAKACTPDNEPKEPWSQRSNTPRFMGVIPAPYFESPATEARWGLYCRGCDTYFGRLFTEHEFVEHVGLHGPVIVGVGKKSSRHGEWGEGAEGGGLVKSMAECMVIDETPGRDRG